MENKRLYHIDVFMPQNLIEQSLLQQKTVKNYIFTKHVKFKIFSKNPFYKDISLNTITKILHDIKTAPIIPFEIESTVIRNKEKVTKYINDMKDLGIECKEAIKYLQEFGGK